MTTQRTVAIVGRPNVGKSTLFNRLVGRRRALVHPTPGVTRDRHAGSARLNDLAFIVTDTPGLEDAPEASLEGRMQTQTAAAVDAADVALLLIDARAGVTPVDAHFADWLRRRSTPVVLVANKCEGRGGEAGLLDAYSLGLGDPVALSAEHGQGLGELYARLAPLLGETEPMAEPEAEAEDDSDRPLQLAIIGRPNVGKSTLINRLIGEDRVLTGPEPGITRDAIEVTWRYDGREVCLIDTAGLRRRARVDDRLEGLSAGQTWHALRFAEVAVVVMDATDMPHRQDLAIASAVLEEGRALVLAVNKWDLIEDPRATLRGLRDRLETSLPQARGVPVVTLSALTGAGSGHLMRAVLQAHAVWNRRTSTGALNRWLSQMTEAHPPPMLRGRPTKCRYITQIKTRPPTFGLWVNQPAALPESYLRYLVNGLRQDFDLPGTPIRIVLRKGKNPYAGKAA